MPATTLLCRLRSFPATARVFPALPCRFSWYSSSASVQPTDPASPSLPSSSAAPPRHPAPHRPSVVVVRASAATTAGAAAATAAAAITPRASWFATAAAAAQRVRRRRREVAWEERARRAEAALLAQSVSTPFTQHQVPVGAPGWTINTLVFNGPERGAAGGIGGRVLDPDCPTMVLTHGYGAGLGFWFRNLDWMARNLTDPVTGQPFQLVVLDWLGCGLSSRPPFLREDPPRPPRTCRPRRLPMAVGLAAAQDHVSAFYNIIHRLSKKLPGSSKSSSSSSRGGSGSTSTASKITESDTITNVKQQQHPTQEVSRPDTSVEDDEAYFIDSLEAWRRAVGLERPFVLAGHSLGGYLSAAYALKHGGGGRVARLVLVSPFGLPPMPDSLARRRPRLADSADRDSLLRLLRPARSSNDALTAAAATSEPPLPWPVRLLLRGWAANVTPQQLLRRLGPALGRRLTARVVRRRFPQLAPAAAGLVAEYLHAVSTGPPAGEYALHALMHVVFALPDNDTPTPAAPAAANAADAADGQDGHRHARSPGGGGGARTRRAQAASAPPPEGGLFARAPMEPRLRSALDPATRMAMLFGDHDWMLSPAVLALPLVRSGRASFHVVPAAGHHLYMDNPDGFHQALVEALRS
ncbi:Alpha/beta hydrolase domain-containing protein 4 [Cladochytrium tenue]|nr:Alpha/beta hydrolase domain-containing protein 4 [Cladochytrium tenue]